MDERLKSLITAYGLDPEKCEVARKCEANGIRHFNVISEGQLFCFFMPSEPPKPNPARTFLFEQIEESWKRANDPSDV